VSVEQALRERLAAAMSPAALGAAGAKQSCAEVVEGADVVFAYHPDLPVVPASNMKLVTATALLAYLGPGYRFDTTLLAAAPPRGGVVEGDLYLRGGGDPLLRLPSYADGFAPGGGVYTNFTKLVGLLRAAGVREVTGSVVGDASRYDSLEAVSSWPRRYDEEGDAGPLSALGLDDGFAEAGPPVPAGAPPAEQAAGVLTHLLKKAGIAVGGPPAPGKTPVGATPVAMLVSPPLGDELGEILRESDNTAMELLTKELGLVQFGSGSTAAGARAVRVDLEAQGLPVAGFVNADGSGLSYYDRVTCSLLVAVLEAAGPQSLLVEDLPVAARSGTLEHQFVGTVAAGRVRAKTGNLDGVQALSGWVYPPAWDASPAGGTGQGSAGETGQGSAGEPKALFPQPVAFAVVLNGLSADVDPIMLTDRVALDLAGYVPPEARPPAVGPRTSE
jgi:D-alanyl-D-alanine carboxypeptidase/D-alanyl-D-alanine-endopeptidase (penicillin-binding protein 4)